MQNFCDFINIFITNHIISCFCCSLIFHYFTTILYCYINFRSSIMVCHFSRDICLFFWIFFLCFFIILICNCLLIILLWNFWNCPDFIINVITNQITSCFCGFLIFDYYTIELISGHQWFSVFFSGDIYLSLGIF